MSVDKTSETATTTDVASDDVGTTTTASSAPAPMTASAATALGSGLLQRKIANRIHRRGGGAVEGNPQASFDQAVGGGGGEVPHRAEMERSFGQDFSGVQASVGKHPEMESLGAQAATQGEKIAFGTASPSKELVAHELTHVVQNRQSGAPASGHPGVSNKSEVSDPGSAAEVEADAVGARAAAGEKVTVHAAPDAMTHGSWVGGEKKPETPSKDKTPQERITDAIKAGDAAGIKAAATTPALQRYAIQQTVALGKDELLTDYAGLIDYMDHTAAADVEKLGSDTSFVNQCAKVFSNEQFAQLTVRMILRVPGTVVEAGAARTEAIRILTSQLRDKEVCKNLLAKKARVIIVPRNKLMTDLPEFKSAQGTYTFDGRPWDTTRGLGGQNTAITEENLLGIDKVDGDTSRKGWKNKAEYDAAIAAGRTSPNEAGKDGPTAADAMTYKPGTYCSGYSTTNHEFFHTIHQYGLNAADSKTILDEYAAKKAKPKETQWADGPRTLKSNAATQADCYSASSHWEYFAQTGCAYQSTNKGTDPTTGNDRNNGKAWVETNEPKLVPLYTKITSNEALANVNPQEQRKKDDEAKAKAEKEKLEKDKAAAAAPTGAKPPAPAGPTAQADPVAGGGDTTVGLVQHV